MRKFKFNEAQELASEVLVHLGWVQHENGWEWVSPEGRIGRMEYTPDFKHPEFDHDAEPNETLIRSVSIRFGDGTPGNYYFFAWNKQFQEDVELVLGAIETAPRDLYEGDRGGYLGLVFSGTEFEPSDEAAAHAISLDASKEA